MDDSRFLEQIYWRDAWFTMECLEDVDAELPAFSGSTIRGALGHLLRAGLCVEPSGCGHDCQHPDGCPYYSLFEQSRTRDGKNAPKAMILLAPPEPELEAIAMGGPVRLPYRTRAGEPVPVLYRESRKVLRRGEGLRFGLRFLGPSSEALNAVTGEIGRHGMVLAGAQFELREARDGGGQLLWHRRFANSLPPQRAEVRRFGPDREKGVNKLRLVFLTPTMWKRERREFEAEELAEGFFEHAMARAAQVKNVLIPGGATVPYLDRPETFHRVTGSRLFRYEFKRKSFRQEQVLDFDGVVGWIDLEGDFDGAMVWARAAEVLRFGQKAAFGMGEVRVLLMA